MYIFSLLYHVCFFQYYGFHRKNSDIEKIQAPLRKSIESVSMFKWYLIPIPVHDHLKVSLWQDYISINIFDIICLSDENCLNNYVPGN